jgi:hypothetical protein
MIPFEANKYRAYARECLRQAETVEKPEARQKLIELSRVWTAAALNEVRFHRTNQAQGSA